MLDLIFHLVLATLNGRATRALFIIEVGIHSLQRFDKSVKMLISLLELVHCRVNAFFDFILRMIPTPDNLPSAKKSKEQELEMFG